MSLEEFLVFNQNNVQNPPINIEPLNPGIFYEIIMTTQNGSTVKNVVTVNGNKVENIKEILDLNTYQITLQYDVIKPADKYEIKLVSKNETIAHFFTMDTSNIDITQFVLYGNDHECIVTSHYLDTIINYGQDYLSSNLYYQNTFSNTYTFYVPQIIPKIVVTRNTIQLFWDELDNDTEYILKRQQYFMTVEEHKQILNANKTFIYNNLTELQYQIKFSRVQDNGNTVTYLENIRMVTYEKIDVNNIVFFNDPNLVVLKIECSVNDIVYNNLHLTNTVSQEKRIIPYPSNTNIAFYDLSFVNVGETYEGYFDTRYKTINNGRTVEDLVDFSSNMFEFSVGNIPSQNTNVLQNGNFTTVSSDLISNSWNGNYTFENLSVKLKEENASISQTIEPFLIGEYELQFSLYSEHISEYMVSVYFEKTFLVNSGVLETIAPSSQNNLTNVSLIFTNNNSNNLQKITVKIQKKGKAAPIEIKSISLIKNYETSNVMKKPLFPINEWQTINNTISNISWEEWNDSNFYITSMLTIQFWLFLQNVKVLENKKVINIGNKLDIVILKQYYNFFTLFVRIQTENLYTPVHVFEMQINENEITLLTFTFQNKKISIYKNKSKINEVTINEKIKEYVPTDNVIIYNDPFFLLRNIRIYNKPITLPDIEIIYDIERREYEKYKTNTKISKHINTENIETYNISITDCFIFNIKLTNQIYSESGDNTLHNLLQISNNTTDSNDILSLDISKSGQLAINNQINIPLIYDTLYNVIVFFNYNESVVFLNGRRINQNIFIEIPIIQDITTYNVVEISTVELSNMNILNTITIDDPTILGIYYQFRNISNEPIIQEYFDSNLQYVDIYPINVNVDVSYNLYVNDLSSIVKNGTIVKDGFERYNNLLFNSLFVEIPTSITYDGSDYHIPIKEIRFEYPTIIPSQIGVQNNDEFSIKVIQPNIPYYQTVDTLGYEVTGVSLLDVSGILFNESFTNDDNIFRFICKTNEFKIFKFRLNPPYQDSSLNIIFNDNTLPSLKTNKEVVNEGQSFTVTLIPRLSDTTGKKYAYSFSGVSLADLINVETTQGEFIVGTESGSITFQVASDLILDGGKIFTIALTDTNLSSIQETVYINDTTDAQIYNLTSTQMSVNEGETFTIMLTSLGVPPGLTSLPYVISGIDVFDLDGLDSLNGEWNLSDITKTFRVSEDKITDGPKTMRLTLFSTTNLPVSLIDITIADTSLFMKYEIKFENALLNSNSNTQKSTRIILNTTSVLNGTSVPFTITGQHPRERLNDHITAIVPFNEDLNQYEGSFVVGFITDYTISLSDNATTESKNTAVLKIDDQYNIGEDSVVESKLRINYTTTIPSIEIIFRTTDPQYYPGQIFVFDLLTYGISNGSQINYDFSGILLSDIREILINGNNIYATNGILFSSSDGFIERFLFMIELKHTIGNSKDVTITANSLSTVGSGTFKIVVS